MLRAGKPRSTAWRGLENIIEGANAWTWVSLTLIAATRVVSRTLETVVKSKPNWNEYVPSARMPPI